MKSITVRMEEEDYERLRERAYRERGSVSGKAGELLGEALRARREVRQVVKAAEPHSVTEAKKEAVKPEVKNAGVEAEKEKGVEVSLAIPVNTVGEAQKRVEEMVTKKAGSGLLSGVPYGRVHGGAETEEERLKRMQAANKDLVKRGGGK